MFSTKNNKINPDVLTQLISELGYLLKEFDLVIDSRKITKNSIFCAYPGTATDGREFIQNAIENSAKVILYEDSTSNQEQDVDEESVNKIPVIPNNDTRVTDCALGIHKNEKDIKYLAVSDLKFYAGLLAAYKYDYPSKKFKTIGITGTNGKTSIAYWLNQAYTQLKKTTGIIGTLGAGIYPEIASHSITTPDPITLEQLLAKFADSKVDMVAMEASSHALDQGRVNGIDFDTAVFTNLTQDHLDYHHDMESYYQAKRELFYWQGLKQAVINLDDEYGARLYSELYGLKSSDSQFTVNNLITYGFTNGDVQANNIKVTIAGTKFNLQYKNESVPVEVKIIGKFNIYNLLAVTAVLLLDGYSLTEIADVLASLTPVCGRMDAIIVPNKPLVVVDFSHTPDSLKNALLTLKEVEHNGKVYCVFGCGGNRDNSKRPIMGAIAAELADEVIVTSDNPRFENPSTIIDQIVAGIKDVPYQRIENRKNAIEAVLKIATANDIVLIAGKGHENYQEINGIKEQFSDFTIATNTLGV